jgi:hypothetical protein
MSFGLEQRIEAGRGGDVDFQMQERELSMLCINGSLFANVIVLALLGQKVCAFSFLQLCLCYLFRLRLLIDL